MLSDTHHCSFLNANCPIHMMGKPTKLQPKDVYTLNFLSDAIVNSYVAGDTVIVGTSQPTNLSICHLDMEEFIAGLFQRGISENALYFDCHNLRSMKVCELAGILEILSSPKVVMTRKYHVVKGPFCRSCERHVHTLGVTEKQVCDDCVVRVRRYLLPTVSKYPSWPARSWNSRSTLVVLSARKSSADAVLPINTFAQLQASIQQSERNPGPSRNTNCPGFPSVMRFIGKFASFLNANCPIHMMGKPTKLQPKDVYTLNFLSDAIVNSYVAGDTVIVGTSQPTFLSICHLDMEEFIAGLFQRGISENALYFYCHNLRSTYNLTDKYETVVLAASSRIS